MPGIKRSLQWGLFKNQTENYYCSYRIIISILNLNHMVFVFYPFCMYTFVFIACDMKNTSKLGFYCTRHYMSPFFCQWILEDNNTRQCNKALNSCVAYDD